MDRYLQQQSQKGRKSAELRKLASTGSQPDTQPESNSGSTVVEIRLQPKVNSPSPSPTPYNKEESIAPKSQRSHFTVPPLEDVEAECVKIQLPVSEALKFVDYYESKGWLVGKAKMKSWKPALRNWQRNQNERQQTLIVEPVRKKELDWRDSV